MGEIDSWVGRIRCGHVIDVLREMPDKSVHCVITSPPYWGLREYGEATKTIWGGDSECEHRWGEGLSRQKGGTGQQKGLKGNKRIEETWDNCQILDNGAYCIHCGAWCGELGLEMSYTDFITHLVEISREVRRVLRDDGTYFIVIGDTYSGGGDMGLPNKCKMLIPHRLGIALVDDGWVLRNDITWIKQVVFEDDTSRGSSMPGPWDDRFVCNSEVVLYLSKDGDNYFDLDAVRAPHKESSKKRAMRGSSDMCKYNDTVHLPDRVHPMTMSQPRKYKGYDNMEERILSGETFLHPSGKNPGDCWQITPKGSVLPHYAGFPKELVRRPLLAGCPEHVCAECGTPYKRRVENESQSKEYADDGIRGGTNAVGQKTSNPQSSKSLHRDGGGVYYKGVFKGWEKKCKCRTGEQKGGIVMDIFMGSGTTAVVAEIFDRRWIGIELNPEYVKLAEERIEKGDDHMRKKEMRRRRVEKAKEENRSLFDYEEVEG